ncbi:insulin-degrading enzyme-like [Temnothorax americanus]|uniref:insulin-degrading enzyme-like n=1 Tax=Temnothorax americanus TaxID=1964332 RepID=UPI004067E362
MTTEYNYGNWCFTLNNKMKVILRNDRNVSNKFSVALDIHIGSFADPKNFPGLANLCQQMIILGKTAQSNRFQELLYKYDGDISLTTSSEHTTYYFHFYTKDYDVVEQILERFVQLFISTPSFNDACIEERIRIMNSKLKTELQHNWFQYFERSTINSAHPYSNYGLCKEKILTEMSIKNIKFTLLNFILKYYSANIMTLGIASNYAGRIEQIVDKIFSEIQNSEIKLPKYFTPFTDRFCTVWYIAPKSDTKNLMRLAFPLPNLEEDCWRRAVNCISFFLEYDNEKSLLGTLKAKNWCNGISISACQEARNLNFFHVVFTLLPKGYRHTSNIVQLFFEYLKLFKTKYLNSPNRRFIKVLNNMLKYGRLEKEEEAQQRIIKIVQQLNQCQYPSTNTLNNKFFREFNYITSTIKILIDEYISPRFIRIYIIYDDFPPLESEWDNADYTESKIKESLIDLWSKEPSKKEERSELLLPDLKFVPDPNIPLYTEKMPEIIKDTLFIQLWYAHATPKSSAIQRHIKMFFHFISPQAYENPLDYILNIIFARLVKISTEMPIFLEDEMQWEIRKTKYGIVLELTSYVPITYRGYLGKVISTIMHLKVLPEEFETLKKKYIKAFKYFARMRPSEQAFCYFQNMLSEKSWPHNEVLKASTSTDITADTMQKFIQKFVNNLHVKCLIYGEISKVQALEIGDTLEFKVKKAKDQTITQTRLLQHREAKLENDTHFLYEVEHNNKSLHDVSCTLVYYQIEETNLSKLALVYHIMAKRSLKFFEDIQHIHKIYMCVCTATGVQGFQIVIDAFIDPYVVQYHIEQFISSTMKYIKQLSKLSIKEFEKYKTDLIRHGEINKTLKLNDISDVIWMGGFTKLYSGDQQKIKIKSIQDIKQTSLLKFYKKHIYDKRATLSVHVSPKRKNKLQEENASPVDASPVDEKDQSEILNFEPKMITHEPLVTIDTSKVSPIAKIKGLKYTLSRWCNMEEWYRIPEARFKKINDIMLFKRTRNYYN